MQVYLLAINFVKIYVFILTASSKEYQKTAELKYSFFMENSITLILFSFYYIHSHTSPNLFIDYNCPSLVTYTHL